MDSISLKDAVAHIVDNRGKTCPTSDAGIPLIATNCVKSSSLYPTKEKIRFVGAETYRTWFRGHPEPGDVLFVNKGSPGEVCLVPDPVDFCIAQDMVSLRPDNEKIDPSYFFAALREKRTKAAIENMHVGTMIPHFKKTDFDKLYLPLPPRRDQEFIGKLYLDLSMRITVNEKMNQTLEDIAKAIFKSWFVDFDPVRAKAEGRSTGLPAEISNLFPDELVDSEIGEIPAGWKSSSLAEIADIQNGYAFKSKDWSDDGEIPVIKIGNVKPTIVDVENCSRVRRAIVSGLDRFKLMRGDILIGMTGYVGEVGLVPNTREMPYLNQRVGRIMPLRNDDYGFVVALCRREEFKSEVENLGTGSAQANVSSGSIKGIRLPLPPQNLRKVFHENASPIIDRILVASEEARCLSDLRDLLLPKLISGELRIPDAEKFLAEAGI